MPRPRKVREGESSPGSGWGYRSEVSTLPGYAKLHRADEYDALSAAGLRLAQPEELDSGEWQFVLYYEGIGPIVVAKGSEKHVKSTGECVLDIIFGYRDVKEKDQDAKTPA